MSTYYVFSLQKVQTGKAHLMLLEVRTEVPLEMRAAPAGAQRRLPERQQKCFLAVGTSYMNVFALLNSSNWTTMICANVCVHVTFQKSLLKKFIKKDNL